MVLLALLIKWNNCIVKLYNFNLKTITEILPNVDFSTHEVQLSFYIIWEAK